jgi:hypothetical protein
MKKKLKDRTKLTPPKQRRVELWDQLLPGCTTAALKHGSLCTVAALALHASNTASISAMPTP